MSGLVVGAKVFFHIEFGTRPMTGTGFIQSIGEPTRVKGHVLNRMFTVKVDNPTDGFDVVAALEKELVLI